MTSHALESVADMLVAEGKGILAADETVPALTRHFDTLHTAACRGRSRNRDIALLASARARRRSRHCISVWRPKRTPGDCPSERDQPAARLEALEDQFLLRARAPGSGAGGLAWPGREPAGRPKCAVPPRHLQRCSKRWELHEGNGTGAGEGLMIHLTAANDATINLSHKQIQLPFQHAEAIP